LQKPLLRGDLSFVFVGYSINTRPTLQNSQNFKSRNSRISNIALRCMENTPCTWEPAWTGKAI